MIYWCGYNFSRFALLLFGQASHWNRCISDRDDILVVGVHRGCVCSPTRFRGRILAINGEDDVFRPFNERTVVTGPGGYEFPYGAMEWLANGFEQYRGPANKHAIAYANSNCVREREEMVAQLSQTHVVHAYGKCDGFGTAVRIKKPFHGWHTNAKTFIGYPYMVAAEHGITKGYVTEKPFVAAAAGAVPIYFGDNQLLARWMNPDRVIFWNGTEGQSSGASTQ